jgi:hypothetical protein
MKIINTERPIKTADYADYLRAKLNLLFQKQRMENITFEIRNDDDSIEILQPSLYGNNFLFRLVFKGNEIDVIKSEHYTDDVNVLTLEDIMNNLYMEYPGRNNIEFIRDRS